jgi:hypothetical protein
MENNEKLIVKMYKNKKSVNEIARELNTYPNKIRRMLIKQGVKLRNWSEAQKIALANGNSIHPTKGKERSDETKIKISESNYEAWKSLTPVELEKRREKFKENWKKRTPDVILDMKKKSAKGIAEAGKTGSRVENLVVNGLKDLGYGVVHHGRRAISSTQLEPDIVIPALNTVIEIDGPGHYKAIWGEDKLQKRIKADMEKNGFFLGQGYCVIRVLYKPKTLSEKRKRMIIDGIHNLLQQISVKHENKIIEVEF